jgi:hypothetical protein
MRFLEELSPAAAGEFARTPSSWMGPAIPIYEARKKDAESWLQLGSTRLTEIATLAISYYESSIALERQRSAEDPFWA